jgi:Ice-binding-like
MKIHGPRARHLGAASLTVTLAAVIVLVTGAPAGAAIVPTVPLGTTRPFVVLAGSTVTDAGSSVLNGSLGLWPGTSTTGSTQVVPPGTTEVANGVAHQAQLDLTAAYVNAAGRALTAPETGADLGNLHLGAGVYAGPSHGALQLTGPLVLDGAGNASSVFIFQTDSSLTTASSSTVTLVNGAQECNVFWQVGSSATLGTGSVFRGNLMALSSITVNSNVVVHGRAMARNGAVTLDSDVFVRPRCADQTGTPVTTSTTAPANGGGTGTTPVAAGTGTSGGSSGTGTGTNGTGSGLTAATNGVPGVSGPPRTGGAPLRHGGSVPWTGLLFAGVVLAAGTADLVLTRRSRARRSATGVLAARPHH